MSTTNSDVEIRRIVAADDEKVASIIRAVMTEFDAVGQGFSIMDAEVDAMSAAYGGPGADYFVALLDGVIVAGAGIGPLVGGPPDVCELKKMYALPEGRGRGIGRRLMNICLDAARDAGYRRCYLETLAHMSEARRLYERNGFAPLDAPMGATGHFGCNGWYVREI